MYSIALVSVSLSNFLLFCSKLAKSQVVAGAAIQVTIFAAKKRHLLEKGKVFFLPFRSNLFCFADVNPLLSSPLHCTKPISFLITKFLNRLHFLIGNPVWSGTRVAVERKVTCYLQSAVTKFESPCRRNASK